MGAKIFLKNPPPPAQLKEHLRKQGVNLTDTQTKFLGEHEGHNGLVIESNKVFCRACNLADTPT